MDGEGRLCIGSDVSEEPARVKRSVQNHHTGIKRIDGIRFFGEHESAAAATSNGNRLANTYEERVRAAAQR